MAESQTVRLNLEVTSSGAVRVLSQTGKGFEDIGNQAERGAQQATSAFSRLQANIITLNQALELAGKAFRIVSSTIETVIGAALQQQSAIQALNAALQTTGRFTPELSARFVEFASSIQRVTTAGDEQIVQATALIAQLTKLDEEGLRKATQGAVGLAAVMNTDLQSAASLVGKAMTGNIGALTRYVGAIDSSLSPSEKQAVLLEKLSVLFDAAKGRALDTAGALAQLENAFSDTLEVLGDAIISSSSFRASLQVLTGALFDAAQGTGDFGASLKEASGALGTLVSEALVDATALILTFAKGTLDAARGLSAIASGEFRKAFDILFAGTGTFQEFRAEILAVAESLKNAGSAALNFGAATGGAADEAGKLGKATKETLSTLQGQAQALQAQRIELDLGTEAALRHALAKELQDGATRAAAEAVITETLALEKAKEALEKQEEAAKAAAQTHKDFGKFLLDFNKAFQDTEKSITQEIEALQKEQEIIHFGIVAGRDYADIQHDIAVATVEAELRTKNFGDAAHDVAVNLVNAREATEKERQALEQYNNAAADAALTTGDISKALEGVLLGTRELDLDILTDLGKKAGASLLQGLLFGKQQGDKAIVGNFQQLFGGPAGGIVGSILGQGGVSAGASFLTGLLPNFGKVIQNFQTLFAGQSSFAGTAQGIWNSLGGLSGAGFIAGLSAALLGSGPDIARGISSGLAVAALIPGPQQPFVAAAAIIASLFGAGFFNALWAPGRIAVEKEHAKDFFNKVFDFDFDVLKERDVARGLLDFEQFAEAGQALGAIFAKAFGDEATQGTIIRFAGQFLANLQELGFSADEAREKMLELAQAMGFDLVSAIEEINSLTTTFSDVQGNNLLSMGEFSEEVREARKNLAEYGETANLTVAELEALALANGNTGSTVVTLNELYAGALDLAVGFADGVNSLLIVNGLLADRFVEVASATGLYDESIRGLSEQVRSGALSIEEAIVALNEMRAALNLPTLELSEFVLDPEVFAGIIEVVEANIAVLAQAGEAAGRAIGQGVAEGISGPDAGRIAREAFIEFMDDILRANIVDQILKDFIDEFVADFAALFENIDLTELLTIDNELIQEFADRIGVAAEELFKILEALGLLSESTRDWLAEVKEVIAASAELSSVHKDLLLNNEEFLDEWATGLQTVEESLDSIEQTLRGLGGPIASAIIDAMLSGAAVSEAQFVALIQGQVARAVLQGMIEGMIRSFIIEPIIEQVFSPIKTQVLEGLAAGLPFGIALSLALEAGASAIAQIPSMIAEGLAIVWDFINSPEMQEFLGFIADIPTFEVPAVEVAEAPELDPVELAAFLSGATLVNAAEISADLAEIAESVEDVLEQFVDSVESFVESLDDTQNPLQDVIDAYFDLLTGLLEDLEAAIGEENFEVAITVMEDLFDDLVESLAQLTEQIRETLQEGDLLAGGLEEIIALLGSIATNIEFFINDILFILDAFGIEIKVIVQLLGDATQALAEEIQDIIDEFVVGSEEAVGVAEDIGDLIEEFSILRSAILENAALLTLLGFNIGQLLADVTEAFQQEMGQLIGSISEAESIFHDLTETAKEALAVHRELVDALEEGIITEKQFAIFMVELVVATVQEFIRELQDLVEELQNSFESVQDFIDAGEDLSSLESDLADLTDEYEQALKDLRKEMIGVILSGDSMGSMLEDLNESFQAQAQAIAEAFLEDLIGPAQDFIEAQKNAGSTMGSLTSDLGDITSALASATAAGDFEAVGESLDDMISFIERVQELANAFDDFLSTLGDDIRALIFEGLSLEDQLAAVGQQIGSLFGEFSGATFERQLEIAEDIRAAILQQFDLQKQLQQQILDDKIAELAATRDANIAKLEANRDADIALLEAQRDTRRNELQAALGFLDERIKAAEDFESERLRLEEDAASERLRLEEQTFDELTRAAESFRDAAKSIQNIVDQFLVSESFLAPIPRLAEAQAQFAAILARAQAGDTGAAGELGGAFQALFGAEEAVFAGTAQGRAIIEAALASLEALGVDFTRRAELSEAELLRRTVGSVEGAILLTGGKNVEMLRGTRDVLQSELDSLDDTFQAEIDTLNSTVQEEIDKEIAAFDSAVEEQTLLFEAAIADARDAAIIQLKALEGLATTSQDALNAIANYALIQLEQALPAIELAIWETTNLVIAAIDNPGWAQTVIDVLNNIALRVNAPIVSPPPRREENFFNPPAPLGSFSLVGQSVSPPGYYLPAGVNVNDPGTFPAVTGALGPFLPLQAGADITRPTLALLGERGSETVVPSAKIEELIREVRRLGQGSLREGDRLILQVGGEQMEAFVVRANQRALNTGQETVPRRAIER